MWLLTGVVGLLLATPALLSAQAGALQVSAPVTITAGAAIARPCLRLTSPRDGGKDYQVGEFVLLEAVACAPTDILEFYVGAQRLGESAGPRYQLRNIRIGVPGVKVFTVQVKSVTPPARVVGGFTAPAPGWVTFGQAFPQGAVPCVQWQGGVVGGTCVAWQGLTVQGPQ